VVEDHPHVAKSIYRGLMSEGYVVRIAATGDEGGALACREAYDLIVLDLMLPGASGMEVLSEMRRPDVRARLAASASDWPWRAGASKRTAAESSWTANRAPGRCSGSFCPETTEGVNLNVWTVDRMPVAL